MVKYALKMIIFDHSQFRFQITCFLFLLLAYAGHYHQMA